MTEQEKETLRLISGMKMEARSMLKLISYLQKETKETFESEINKWLDRIYYLNQLEKELKNKEER